MQTNKNNKKKAGPFTLAKPSRMVLRSSDIGAKHLKAKINCPICNELKIKQYINQHIHKMHRNDEYCKLVSRGFVYKRFKNQVKLFPKEQEFYCNLCNKLIMKKSKNTHLKSKLHLILKSREINENIEKNQDYTPKINTENTNNIFINNDNLEIKKFDELNSTDKIDIKSIVPINTNENI